MGDGIYLRLRLASLDDENHNKKMDKVYNDLEKFHRVIGYYEGQEIKPLEIHERHINLSLEQNLRQSEEYIRRIQYDLKLSEVSCDNRIVFRPDKLEASLVYSLFSEGIQSLVCLRDLTASEVRDWCLLIRGTLLDFDRGGLDDLASVLWKAPFRNLRSRVYNSLLDLAAEESPRRLKEAKKKLDNSWHMRDQEWVVPEASNVVRSESAHKAVDTESITKNYQKLSSPEIREEEEGALKLDTMELSILSEEMASYDENQVQFNLLNMLISSLLELPAETSQLREGIVARLQSLTAAIVMRFQPGLMLHLIDQLEKMSANHLAAVGSGILETISNTLKQPASEKRLIASLKDAERSVVSRRLLPYIDPVQFKAVIEHFLLQDEKDALVEFLDMMLKRDLPHDKLMFEWGEDILVGVLPLLRRLDWPTKYNLLERAIRSPYPKLARQASFFLANMKLDSQIALQVYDRLPDEIREIWIRALAESQPQPHWKVFILKMFQTHRWTLANESMMRSRFMLGWAELALKYIGMGALSLFEPYVRGRKMIWWPKHSSEREAIIKACLQFKPAEGDKKHLEWLLPETSVFFQKREIKDRLEILRNKL